MKSDSDRLHVQLIPLISMCSGITLWSANLFESVTSLQSIVNTYVAIPPTFTRSRLTAGKLLLSEIRHTISASAHSPTDLSKLLTITIISSKIPEVFLKHAFFDAVMFEYVITSARKSQLQTRLDF